MRRRIERTWKCWSSRRKWRGQSFPAWSRWPVGETEEVSRRCAPGFWRSSEARSPQPELVSSGNWDRKLPLAMADPLHVDRRIISNLVDNGIESLDWSWNDLYLDPKLRRKRNRWGGCWKSQHRSVAFNRIMATGFRSHCRGRRSKNAHGPGARALRGISPEGSTAVCYPSSKAAEGPRLHIRAAPAA